MEVLPLGSYGQGRSGEFGGGLACNRWEAFASGNILVRGAATYEMREADGDRQLHTDDPEKGVNFPGGLSALQHQEVSGSRGGTPNFFCRKTACARTSAASPLG